MTSVTGTLGMAFDCGEELSVWLSTDIKFFLHQMQYFLTINPTVTNAFSLWKATGASHNEKGTSEKIGEPYVSIEYFMINPHC